MTQKKNNSEIEIHSLILLKKEFYLQGCVEVAKQLLGKYFVKKDSRKYLVGKIVETEAYSGIDDQASHSFPGLTNRNKIMFEEGGRLYVYLTYGIHHCANVVTGEKNVGEAVLIRAVEPVLGIEKLSMNRFNKKIISNSEFINLANGPGKFCKAFGINLKDNGSDLLKGEFYIAEKKFENQINIQTSKRIGISKSKDFLWRFYISGNKFVSNIKNQK